ncbi:unnamed protein product [Paramecium sonneborni]|uniref:WD40-repeat-containing domain n=1 Tax=Paramecium sonneborni TaxID=65129 RepID=A0A8S1QL60_9CILI|nr:unnamed protein product [Paramecium sonneborni]
MLQQEQKDKFRELLQRKNQDKLYSRYKRIESEAKICDLSFSGSKLITAQDIDVVIYHFDQEKLIQNETIQNLHKYLIYSVCFSKSGNWFFTAGYETIIKLWEKKDNNWKCSQILNSHKDSVLILLMTTDEKQLFSRSRDKTIKIWGKQDEIWQCQRTIQASSGIVESLCINPQNNMLSFGCKNNLLIWHNTIQNKWRKYQAIVSAHTQLIESVCFISDGSQLASGANDIKLWKIFTDNLQYRLTQVIAPLGNVSIMEFNDKLQFLFAVTNKKFIQIWKVEDYSNLNLQQTIQVQKSEIFYEEDQFYESIGVSENGNYVILKDNYNDYLDIWQLK